jgi:hypothetical protein
MAPCGAHCRIVTSPEPDDQPSSGPLAPTLQPVNTQDTEHFALNDVSGSNKPAYSHNEGVNNPDTDLTKSKSMADVDYYFQMDNKL